MPATRHHPGEELQSLQRRKSCPAARQCHTPPGWHSPPSGEEEEDGELSSEDEEEMEMKKVSGSISSFSLASGELYCSAKPDTTYYRYQLPICNN